MVECCQQRRPSQLAHLSFTACRQHQCSQQALLQTARHLTGGLYSNAAVWDFATLWANLHLIAVAPCFKGYKGAAEIS